MRRLIIPSHTVTRYRDRVRTDREADKRSADEIRFIIESSLHASGSFPERVTADYHALVNFRDISKGSFFGYYYLVLNPARESDGSVVCNTIKAVSEVVAYLDSPENRDLSFSKFKKRMQGESRDKMRHYIKYDLLGQKA